DRGFFSVDNLVFDFARAVDNCNRVGAFYRKSGARADAVFIERYGVIPFRDRFRLVAPRSSTKFVQCTH
ncbi:MAG: hypothetical protein PUB54_00280, partial [Lachnospiraceae bacterium]|nr:hypothetical protein [Lachnospiraceae bacterium]